MIKPKGKIRRFLSFFWNSVSALRRFVGNLLFLLLVVFLLVVVFFDGDEDVPEGVALILSPQGNIVEQKTESVLALDIFGEAAKEETLLKDIIDVIDFAKDDERIEVMVLDLRKMGAVGISKLQAIGAGLERFKSSGKQVFAFGDYYNQRQYYLGAHADKLYLNPMGGVMLHGFGLYRKYYKTALDKLQIQFHVFKVGTYKSALEPFLRDSMSDYAKEANLAWLNILWNYYKIVVTEQRGLDPQDLDDYINNIPGHLAKAGGDAAVMALSLGLVDELKTRDEVREELIELVGKDKDGITFKQIAFDKYLSRIRPGLMESTASNNKIGIIVASGIIMDGEQPAGRIGGDTMADLLVRAREDENVKAVVVRIDSGGGSANASEIIHREIELTRRAGKPVFVSMGSIAASGGYWIAAPADQIWATPTTITGSIGIFGAFPTFERSLKFLGITSDGVGTTKLSDAFDPSRPLNAMVAQSMQQIIEQGYRRFIQRVAEGRNMRPEAVEKIAQGRVWAGTTAMELGLVDKIGDLQDAVAALAERVDLIDYDITYITQPLTTRERLIKRLNRLIAGIFSAFNPAGHPVNRLYDSVIDTEIDHVLRANDPAGLYAYCLNCNLQ
ncbi:MAG: signal peptide peptidase SppA [Desulfobacterales bacterium]|nr:signal peptide peptidase SppA [Desulfobacterales bacterium]